MYKVQAENKNTRAISEKILAIDWHNFDTAYGNAAKDISYYVTNEDNHGYVPNVAQSLLNLFSGNKETALQASHNLWCSLCHQHSFVSSAALPAYDILFYGLQHLDDELKVEILDIIMGFAVCLSKDASKTSWQSQLRTKLEKDKPYFKALTLYTNEDIADFAQNIVQEL